MLDLVIIVILSAILVPLVEFTTGAGRIILGLIFLLFSPGYSLIAALFPGRYSLDTLERLALSFGLSIATIPLIGLLLNYTPLGIRLYPVLLSVLAFIIIMSTIACIRRNRLSPEERFQFSFKGKAASLRQSLSGTNRLDKLLNIMLVVAIIGAIGTLCYVVASPKTGERFTEFYILGQEGKADDYPREITLGESAWVTVGIINREQETCTYLVQVNIQNEPDASLGPITLEHDQKYEDRVTFTPENPGQDQKVEFVLSKEDNGEPYLHLHLWLDVVDAGPD